MEHIKDILPRVIINIIRQQIKLYSHNDYKESNKKIKKN